MTSTMNRFAPHGYILEPGSVYSDLDNAMKAASCLCGNHPDGSTIYCTTDPTLADPKTGEAYIVANAAVRPDGSTWPAPTSESWEAIYVITKPRRRPKTYPVARPDGTIVHVTVPENED